MKKIIIIIITLALSLSITAQQNNTITLGTRTFQYNEVTPRGIPVIPMWKAQMPTNDRENAAGFPILEDAKHYYVWQPTTPEEGTFNHFAALFFHNNRFHAMWVNNWHCENCAGQRILYSSSKDAMEWTSPVELFPSPGPVLTRGERGLWLASDRWAVVDGKLYAVVYVFGTGSHSYTIAREIAHDGTFGTPFPLRQISERAAVPEFMRRPRFNSELSQKFNNWYKINDEVSFWAYNDNIGLPSRGIDETRLLESFAWRSKQGMVIGLRDYSTHTRDNVLVSSNRIYVSFPDGKGGWTAAYPTDIPDSHSRAQARRLSDGRVLLVGNQIAHKFDEGIYLSRDPLTIAVSPDGEFFTKVFALRSGGQDGTRHRIQRLPGQGPTGYGYPSMIIHNDMIYVLYSINKEDMAITVVPLSAIK